MRTPSPPPPFDVRTHSQCEQTHAIIRASSADDNLLQPASDDKDTQIEHATSGIVYLLLMGVLTLGGTLSPFAPLAGGILLWSVASVATRFKGWSFLARPFLRTALALPLLTVLTGVIRHAALSAPAWLGVDSLALPAAAAFYFWRRLEKRTPSLLAGSAGILNVAFILLWRELSFSDPQFFMIPLGLSLLGLIELLKTQIDAKYIDPLRYVGALTILVSPTFPIVEGSWLHLLTLMLASVLITLFAIGLRARALMYAGTAFLTADIVAMVVRGSIDHTNLLWIAGIVVGAAVVGLAAYCERHREEMLQRLRMIAAELQTWD